MTVLTELQVAKVDRVAYPWAQMHPGDSFLVPAVKVPHIRSLVSRAARKYRMRFVLEHDEHGDWRVRRVG